MPLTAEITESLIRDNISRSVSDVFTTMVKSTIEYRDSITTVAHTAPVHPNPPHVSQVVGTVGFVGDINGLIYLYFEVGLASHCTSRMLSMTPEEVEEGGTEIVNDAIGELTNMIVGSFKNRLCDAGLPCKLTVPSILRGADFSIEATGSAKRYIYAFDEGGRRLVADILMTADQ